MALRELRGDHADHPARIAFIPDEDCVNRR
jgi:hypothetical protein